MNIFKKYNELKKIWDKYTEGFLGIIIYIILGFVIAYSINIFLMFTLNTDTPVVAVFSESMVPNLEIGDMVIVIGSNDIKIGDVVVYDSPVFKYPIIHRVIAISDDKIQTKGDHNMIADPWETPVSKIHGKALLKIPVLGWVKIIFTKIVGI